MKQLKASGSYCGLFCTQRFDTGAATDADSTPTATANKNGIDDGSFTLTVTKIDTGRYKVTGTVPAGYTAGDSVIILKARAANGSSSDAGRVSSSSVSGLIPLIAGMSSGLGR
jgi:hypothetical protein